MADFDGFAAMIGLLKMHPDAKFVFPGSKEAGLRHFLQETGYEFPEIGLKELQDIRHVILVDASRMDRLGELAGILKSRPKPFIEIYDHHPPEQSDIQADRFHFENYGSTTTIVVTELMGIPVTLTSLEASILLTGIHEDTANFLSTGTTQADFEAALFLLKNGAELTLVNRLLTHRLESGQVAFFNTMVANCETLEIRGHTVVLSAFSWPTYVSEAAYLVHRLMDLEPIGLFFALVLMDNRVHIIARNMLQSEDAGKIVQELGGGGHKMAASAILKSATLIEAREKLLEILHKQLHPVEKARDLMKTDVISIDLEKTIEDAAEKMNTYRVNALPVTNNGAVVGTISRQIVDGAIFHGLKDRSVREYMTSEFTLIDPDTALEDVVKQMIDSRMRFVLVGADPSHVQGVITRMDLLRFQYELTPKSLALKKGKSSENLEPMLKKRLPEPVLELLRQCGEVAEAIGSKIYLVGGMVRDLLLHRDNMDIDLVVEGDGIQFAEAMRKQRDCEISVHRQFGTASILFRDNFKASLGAGESPALQIKIDVATARTESYHAPAALPQVRGGILREDLYRRDFTINTLTIDLSPSQFGRLIDYFGGWDDLHHGVIRVLHSLSFIDDPTRTLRAVRFATRFNFRISKDTHRLIESAVDSRVVQRLSGKRFWAELRILLSEEHPILPIRLLHQYKLPAAIHPDLTVDPFTLELLYRVQDVLSWFRLNFLKEEPRGWLLYLMVLLEKLERNDRVRIAQDFQLTSDLQEIVKVYKTEVRDIHTELRGKPSATLSELYFLLKGRPCEILLYAMARTNEDPVKQKISTYLRDLRSVRLDISGDDVIRLGLRQGPKVKEVLDLVLRARLDRQLGSREQQLELAKEIVLSVLSDLRGESAV